MHILHIFTYYMYIFTAVDKGVTALRFIIREFDNFFFIGLPKTYNIYIQIRSSRWALVIRIDKIARVLWTVMVSDYNYIYIFNYNNSVDIL